MTARDIIARAYDREQAAQMGEPDPWKDGKEDPQWQDSLGCADAAIEALSAAGYRILGPADVSITDAMVDAAIEAENHAFDTVRMVKCKRCEGRGYHHGFGEDGADPDWCSHCGGGGCEPAEGEDTRPMREAIAAALRALRKEAE